MSNICVNFLFTFSGMRFGQMQSKLAVVKLISSFKFSKCVKTEVPIKFNPSSPFIEPQGGIWLKVEIF